MSRIPDTSSSQSPIVPVTHDIRQLLALTLTDGLGPVRTAKLLGAFGSPHAVLGASASALARVQGIGEKKSAAIKRAMAATTQAVIDEELERAHEHNVTLLPIGHPSYPPLLTTIHDPPTILYVKGQLIPEDSVSLAIVGSRDCSHYGLEQAARFAGIIAHAGLTIISGGARGIDTSAHRAALDNAGRTLVVLGCGLAHCYPPENKPLFDTITDIDQATNQPRGAIISALPMNTHPASKNFPPRNRIISGLSLGTLVVEAAQRSGALITARLAAEEHHRDVFAIPGRIDSPSSAGTNNLIVTGGAAPVTEPAHILDRLQSQAHTLIQGAHQLMLGDRDHADINSAPARSTSASLPAPADPVHAKIITTLTKPMTADQLLEHTSLPAHELNAALTMLELTGHITRNGPRFIKK